MSATIVTVTAIRVRTNCDSMFDGLSSDDIKATDVDATVEAYMDELAAELQKDHPQARIDIRNDTVYRTEVGCDTDQDQNQEADEDVWSVRQEVQNAVDDCAALVWDRGTFWVERKQ